MRFMGVNTFSATRIVVTDDSKKLYDRLTIPKQDDVEYKTRYEIIGNEQLDFIAVKMYGENSEPDWYRIADRNAKEIIGWRGDFSLIRYLYIPVNE